MALDEHQRAMAREALSQPDPPAYPGHVRVRELFSASLDGARTYKLCIVARRFYAEVHVGDRYYEVEPTAQGILNALARNGWLWTDVDEWVATGGGPRPYMAPLTGVEPKWRFL
jgi:hypothetical protein